MPSSFRQAQHLAQLEPVVSVGIAMVTLAGVAALAREVMRVAFHHPSTGSGHSSIPWEAKRPLIDRYGKWAVELAEALCPENDVACVEREAKRLIEVRRYRR